MLRQPYEENHDLYSIDWWWANQNSEYSVAKWDDTEGDDTEGDDTEGDDTEGDDTEGDDTEGDYSLNKDYDNKIKHYTNIHEEANRDIQDSKNISLKIDNVFTDKHHPPDTCYICKNKKDMLSCNCKCDIGICYSCMSIQINKFLHYHHKTWSGKSKEIIIENNLDDGGFSWNCPGCEASSVITENELKLCAKAKSRYDKAIAILKG